MTFKDLLSHVPSISYGHRIHPVRDWLALVTAAGVLLLASIAWNAWLYYNVTKTVPASTEETTSQAPGLDALPKAQAVLEQRAAEETKYRSFYEFVDPSH